jgi:NhaA family Na+:H+ antiporter
MTPVNAAGVGQHHAASPVESDLIEKLHPWIAFGIMPVFALANAGVVVSGKSLDEASWRVVSAVCVGLIVGKPLGVLVGSWLTLRLGIGTLPSGVTLRHLVVLGVIAGMGFTMALFIAQLAFAPPPLLAAAKLGVLAASAGTALLALTLGPLLLRRMP